VLQLPGHDRVTFALKDSARIIAPHAAHSKARGERGSYVRNFIMVERELVHADSRASLSLASTSDAGSVPQRTVLKLLLPPGPNDSQLDARRSSAWGAINTSDPANIVDYFYDGPWESRQKELILLLIVQCANARSDAGVEPASDGYPWRDVWFEESFVLAILRTDETANPAAIFMSDDLMHDTATHEFVKRAFLDCPILRAHCAACSKPPEAFVVR
jgi:hypothetical protein